MKSYLEQVYPLHYIPILPLPRPHFFKQCLVGSNYAVFTRVCAVYFHHLLVLLEVGSHFLPGLA
jgi:hypothetical protein